MYDNDNKTLLESCACVARELEMIHNLSRLHLQRYHKSIICEPGNTQYCTVYSSYNHQEGMWQTFGVIRGKVHFVYSMCVTLLLLLHNVNA